MFLITLVTFLLFRFTKVTGIRLISELVVKQFLVVIKFTTNSRNSKGDLPCVINNHELIFNIFPGQLQRRYIHGACHRIRSSGYAEWEWSTRVTTPIVIKVLSLFTLFTILGHSRTLIFCTTRSFPTRFIRASFPAIPRYN